MQTFNIRPVPKEEVEAAFKKGSYTIDERFPGCGFVYFPQADRRGPGREGRVSWDYEKEDDQLSISPGWGFPTDTQKEEILRALALYVTYTGQASASA